MMALWLGFVGLFILRLIRRHGWEYVPIVLLAFGAWWYFGNHGAGAFRDGMLLTAIGGVHFVTRRDITSNATTDY